VPDPFCYVIQQVLESFKEWNKLRARSRAALLDAALHRGRGRGFHSSTAPDPLGVYLLLIALKSYFIPDEKWGARQFRGSVSLAVTSLAKSNARVGVVYSNAVQIQTIVRFSEVDIFRARVPASLPDKPGRRRRWFGLWYVVTLTILIFVIVKPSSW
jgi:hypothetical protein